METKNFNEKTGKLVQAPKSSYHTFEPNDLPLKIKYDEELIRLLSEAILSLGNLSNAGQRLPNPNLLIMPYLKKEAVFSSKIEGTRTSLSEVFLHEKERTTKRDDDLYEVLNYIKALQHGLKQIKDKTISQKLIKDMHKILMQGVRGEDKEPGRYKSHQNWIGSSDDIMEAKFVPASPKTTPILMQNLIEYLNSYEISTPLIKSAISHYQFETVHPFRDGNGRIGRLLIILYLCKSKVLSQPLLYLSAYFEKNRERYNEYLFKVSSKGGLEEWIKFFLKGIKYQSEEALNIVSELENYHHKCRERLLNTTNSNNALKLLEHLFANPYLTIPEVQEILGVYYPTAENNVRILVENDILKELKNQELEKEKKAKLFYAPKIIEILKITS